MTDTAHSSSRLIRDWTFKADPFSRWHQRRVVKAVLRQSSPAPKWRELKPVSPQRDWFVYFIFSPSGELEPTHHFTLYRLREEGFAIVVVFASRDPAAVSKDIFVLADALYWKALEGYDFSAYKIALDAIARRSPGADVVVMNDSVFGPFTPIRPFLEKTTWELTGFTATSKIESHIQSYAFMMADVTPARIRKLWPVFVPFRAFNRQQDVIDFQESRFARVANQQMTVGAFWYAKQENPTLSQPFELLEQGFPFMKRSLIGKSKEYQDIHQVEAFLRGVGHPL